MKMEDKVRQKERLKEKENSMRRKEGKWNE